MLFPATTEWEFGPENKPEETDDSLMRFDSGETLEGELGTIVQESEFVMLEYEVNGDHCS